MKWKQTLFLVVVTGSISSCSWFIPLPHESKGRIELDMTSSGTRFLFYDGPFSFRTSLFQVWEITDMNRWDGRKLWEIVAEDADGGAEQIVYGRVPAGFRQIFPVAGTTETLEIGKIYNASGSRWSGCNFVYCSP